jgi:hypothetical protein
MNVRLLRCVRTIDQHFQISPSNSSADPRADGSLNTKTANGLIAFWAWLQTPLGFLTLIYGLNIIAWGGMLFLLICKAAPAMCHPSCDDINSPRQKWIEIDSQILNALFCIPGFGLAPWRIRDLYLWAQWRTGGIDIGLTRLSEIHCSWFYGAPNDVGILCVPCSTEAAPIDIDNTRCWTMDLFVWCNFLNTIFQVCLATCMWSMNRFHRPGWATGLFVALVKKRLIGKYHRVKKY